MICSVCGKDIPDGSTFCAACGCKLEAFDQEVAVKSTANEKLLAIFKDKLFLAICLVLSAATLCALAQGGGLPVITILYAVFAWIAYIGATSNKTDPRYVKWISGTVFAEFVLGWVAFGALVLVAFSFYAVTFFPSSDAEMSSLLQELQTELGAAYNVLASFGITIDLLLIIGAVMLTVLAVITGIYTWFCLGTIHKFTKGLHTTAAHGFIKVEKINKVYGWMIALGVYNIVSGLSTFDLLTILVDSLLGAAAILGALLIKKNFNA